MIFPLHINRRIKISKPLDEVSRTTIIQLIVDDFKLRKVNEFKKTKGLTTFKNKLFNGQGRNHIFTAIDGGTISADEQTIKLSFSTIRTALITTSMAIFFGLISQKIIFGVIAFFWLYGMNVLLFSIRSIFLVKKLKKKIEELEYDTV